MFGTLLIANRGEIALRVAHTARRLGMRTIAVHSDADRDAPHLRACDDAVRIASYLDMAEILNAPGEAVHPGYGFLSENPAFAEAVIAAGRTWVGPPPAAMRALGDKANAKRIAAQAGVPVLPTYDGRPEYPLVIKAVAGGGGRGMRLVRSAKELDAALASARSEAEHAFGDGRLLLEKAVIAPRHVEVQVFADAQGNVVHLGERDCSVQRRHQKLVEESPSPAVDAKLRAKLGAAAIAVARAAAYAGAGTIEFLLDESGAFFFIEANARLQVEHSVTEAVTGLDLVAWQLRLACGEPLEPPPEPRGHAVEARLYAEDPRTFLPQAGRIERLRLPGGIRVDAGVEEGDEVGTAYDPLLAKLVAHAETREEALALLREALAETEVRGVTWGDLQLLFSDDSVVVSGRRHFFNYVYGPPSAATIVPEGLHTADGIGIGSTVADLRRQYPGVQVYPEEIYGPYFVVNENFSGFLTGVTDSDTVISFIGGIGCGE